MTFKNKAVGLIAAAMLFTGGAAVAAPVFGGITASAVTSSVRATKLAKPVLNTPTDMTKKTMTVSWSPVSGADGYYLYRYASNCKMWIRIADLKGNANTSYFNTDLCGSVDYRFKVKAYKGSSSKTFSDDSAVMYAASLPIQPLIMGASNKSYDSFTLHWAGTIADGYEVYYQKKGALSWTLAGTLSGRNNISCDITGLSGSTKYVVKVRSYRTGEDKVKRYSDYSSEYTVTTKEAPAADDFSYTPDTSAIARLNKASLNTSRGTYTYNFAQGSSASKSTVALTSAEKTLLKNFAASHFKSGWTAGQKADYMLQWLHFNVEYCDGADGRAPYSDLYKYPNELDAVLNGRIGQCVQYNGALVKMMAYLGFDVTEVRGQRGYEGVRVWDHTWGEVNINGSTYVMEAGNTTDDKLYSWGWYYWMYSCKSYSELYRDGYSNYIMYGKAVKS